MRQAVPRPILTHQEDSRLHPGRGSIEQRLTEGLGPFLGELDLDRMGLAQAVRAGAVGERDLLRHSLKRQGAAALRARRRQVAYAGKRSWGSSHPTRDS
jgi:hypothetical protein